MKIHFRIKTQNKDYVYFSAFINNKYCGTLRTTHEEFVELKLILSKGCGDEEFKITGPLYSGYERREHNEQTL